MGPIQLIQKHLFFRQHQTKHESQVCVHTDEASDVQLFFETLCDFLTQAFFFALLATAAETANKTPKELGFQRLCQLDLIKQALNVGLAEAEGRSRARSYLLLCWSKSLVLFALFFLSAWYLFLDRGGVHSAAILCQEEGREYNNGAVKAANISDHREDSVDLPLAFVQSVRKLQPELDMRQIIIIIIPAYLL